jgi:hypothetical protein
MAPPNPFRLVRLPVPRFLGVGSSRSLGATRQDCTGVRRCAAEILTGANNALHPIRQLFSAAPSTGILVGRNSCLIGFSALLAPVSISDAHLRTCNTKRRKVLGDITNQAALPGRIRPSTIYKGYKAYNTTLCALGSYFRKYHDYIAKKK